MKLKCLTQILDHQYPSIEEAEEFDRHVLDHQYSPLNEAEEFHRHVPDHK